MGYIRHEAVIAIVNDWTSIGGQDEVQAFRDLKAQMPEEFQPLLVGPVPHVVNGGSTVAFLYLPDGSKEGWADSDTGDVWRDRFLALCRSLRYPEFAHLRVGGDDGGAEVLAGTPGAAVLETPIGAEAEAQAEGTWPW